MSDTVLTVLIVAAAIVLVLFLLRKRLSNFSLRASRRGIATQMRAHAPSAGPGSQADTVIKRNIQHGTGHRIDIRRGAVVEDNTQLGDKQTITTRPDPRPSGKTR